MDFKTSIINFKDYNLFKVLFVYKSCVHNASKKKTKIKPLQSRPWTKTLLDRTLDLTQEF